jgi:Domain of unknown function (DUF1707)
MASRALLRASDSDREQIVERLHVATTEGRLRADELDERVGAAFSARTYGELDALVADLPVPLRRDSGRPSVPMWARGALAVVLLLASLGALAGAGHQPRFGPRMLDVAPQDRAQFFDGVPHAHHGFAPIMALPAMAGLFLILGLCVALGWIIVRDRPTTNG